MRCEMAMLGKEMNERGLFIETAIQTRLDGMIGRIHAAEDAATTCPITSRTCESDGNI